MPLDPYAWALEQQEHDLECRLTYPNHWRTQNWESKGREGKEREILVDRLGSPPAAACLDTGRGGTAGDAESNLRLQCLYLNVTLSPPYPFFFLGWSVSFLPDTKLPQGSRAVCRDLMTRTVLPRKMLASVLSLTHTLDLSVGSDCQPGGFST